MSAIYFRYNRAASLYPQVSHEHVTHLPMFARISLLTTSSLPNELVLQIVGLLKDDRKSVEACSLVCVTWCLISHSILFEHVKINFSDDLPNLLDTKIGRISKHIETVKTLTLMKCRHATGYRLELQTLLMVSNRFPNLKELELVSLRLAYSGDGDSLCPQSSVKTLRLITSSTITAVSRRGSTHVNMLYSLFTAFPHLEDLHLYGISAQEYKHTRNLDNQHIPPLRVLSSRSAAENFPDFLQDLQPIKWSFVTIDYTGYHTMFENLIVLCELKGLKDSLKILRFGVSADALHPGSDYSATEGMTP